MKDRKLVYSFILGILIAGCGALPAAPAAGPSDTPVVIVVTATSGAAEAAPTTTTIPLPQPQPQSTLVLGATLPIATISVPVIGGSTAGPIASPKNVQLNCRGGPALRWPVGDVLDPGENVQVIGRSTDSSWWYVKDPAAPVGTCWISAAFSTITGNIDGVQVVVVTGVPMINGTPVGTVTHVEITLEPDTIDVPGCIGPIQPITIAAKIWVDGPVDIRFHFEGDDIPNLNEHHYGFSRADIDDVTDHFTPPLIDGKHHVFLVVDDIDLSGTGDVATYTINC